MRAASIAPRDRVRAAVELAVEAARRRGLPTETTIYGPRVNGTLLRVRDDGVAVRGPDGAERNLNVGAVLLEAMLG